MTPREDLRDKLLGGGKISANVREKADVAIVGSGCGGAVMAKELAERGLSVVLLEEGGYFHPRDFNQVVADMMIKLYRDAGSTLTLGRPPISMPLGKCVGGTAMINSGTCFRTPDWVLKKWRIVFGIEGVTPEAMRPHFERVERICHIQDLPEEHWGGNAMVVRRGAERLGLTMKALKHNARRCHGCGTCFIGCPDGEKESPNVNYVPMAVAAGARVYTRAKAERVAIRNGRAAGLSGTLLDETGKQARARIDVDAKVVVLSAGAFHTPVMLLHNRIGNSSGQVGRNLSIHPAVRVNAEMPDDVRGWIGVPQGTYIDDFAADGIMLEGIFMPPAGGAPMFPYVGMRHKELAARFIKLAAYGVMIGDTSRGRVLADKLRPVILYNLNREDTRRMLRGLAVMSRIFFAAGAKTVFPNLAGAMTISERDIARIEDRKPNPRDMEMMAFHPLGTCRMGPDPRTSVVGPNLECHDVPGLFVVDGSVFPSSLGVNPQETIMAFATKAAAELADARSTYF